MDELLPHYERELTLLRQHARQFAESYPKVAGRLQMSGENVEDPHVERLIESFALLAARVHKKLDDEYPEFTDALLQVLYPHYLRPFPSCSVACFDIGSGVSQLTTATRIDRGTLLNARPINGLACKFRTAYPVWLAPLRIRQFAYSNTIRAPESYRLPAYATGVITADFALLSEQAQFSGLDLPVLRLFIDTDSALIAQLRKAIFHGCVGIALETAPGAWQSLPRQSVLPVGFKDDESLLDFDARSAQAYRLLTEFFSFPEKFNFVDLDFKAIAGRLPADCRGFKIHFLLGAGPEMALDERLLEQLGPQHLKLHCTPVVNLFRQHADPIRLTHDRFDYPVVADHRRAYAYEVYSLDSVHKVVQTPQGETIREYRSFYSLKHGDQAGQSSYWHLTCDESLAELSPGFEYRLSLVDVDFDPTVSQTETVSLQVTCTNRDLPAQMPYGQAGGDLFLEGGSVVRTISTLRKPTQTFRFPRTRGSQWRLVSHLTLNHFSLTTHGGGVLREALSLYNLNGSLQNRRMIEAITGVEQKPAVARMPGNPFPAFVRGLEIIVTLDEDGFVGTGVHLFAQLLDHFFGMYVHANSFTQLVFRSARTGEEIVRCPPRNGLLALA